MKKRINRKNMKETAMEQPAMKQDSASSNIRGGSIRVLGCLGGFLAGVGFLVYTALADSPPVLTIAPLGSNQFSITITNATSPTNYLLEWTPILADTNYPWLVVATNSPGQTNFNMDMGPWPMGFLRVMVGWDGDGDSIPDWIDAQPFNASVGALRVTIDSPLNGSVFY